MKNVMNLLGAAILIGVVAVSVGFRVPALKTLCPHGVVVVSNLVSCEAR